MLSLYFYYKTFINTFFTFVYIYVTHIFSLILFYPLGIFLGFLVLIWMSIILINYTHIFKFYYRLIEYNLLSFCFNNSLVFSNLLKSLPVIYNLIYSLIYFFSEYIYVFNFKKLEIYIYLFIIIFLFVF